MATNSYLTNINNINRDVTNMLNRYNNHRIEVWNEANILDGDWSDNVNHNLELDGLPDYFMNDAIVSNESEYGPEKMYTLQFDLNPWYIHFSGLRWPGFERCSCYLFIFWHYRVYPDHPEEKVVSSRPYGSWIIKNPKTFFGDILSENMIIQNLLEAEAIYDDGVNFPMIPVASPEYDPGYGEIFAFLGIDENAPNAAKGRIVSLREYLTFGGFPDNEILTLGSGNPLLNEDMILFRTPLFMERLGFWLKNSLFVNFIRRGGRQRLKEYLYGVTTAEKTINHHNLSVDDTRLDQDVLGLIKEYGGKKKRKSLKKNKKNKRKKSLKKKQRKTKRKSRR